jgi:hypothetical protein
MPHHDDNPRHLRQTRRQFLKKTGATAALAMAGVNLASAASAANPKNSVVIVLEITGDSAEISPIVKAREDLEQAPIHWAAEQLRQALAARGVSSQIIETLIGLNPDLIQRSQIGIVATGRGRADIDPDNGPEVPNVPESVVLAPVKYRGRTLLYAKGADPRGISYALLELADRVQFAKDPLEALHIAKPIIESPANKIRSISRAFVSDVEDKPWFQDRNFWPPYLDMLATNRFNRFNLALGIGYDFTTDIRDCYFHFAYPFLLAVPGYNVKANPLPDAERDANLEMLRFISEETVKRGMDFQLGIWTHAYEWTQSPNANYIIDGLTRETHAPYCRDALRMLLKACPAIGGITFRIHGESGVPEGNYDLWKIIFDGIVTCGRPIEIDMHAKGMDQSMIDVALATGMPVNISPKFWAEHMGLPYMQGAIRPQEMPPKNARTTGAFKLSSGSRQFLRYGYGDLLAEKRPYGVLHRLWPGTQRLLLWGDPATASAYGKVASFCDSKGMEIFEPLFFKGRKGSGLPGGRDGYADLSLRAPGGDFEKYRYTYRVWGRNLYNPNCDPDPWQRLLRQQFGNGAEPAEAALAAASRILPLVTTAHDPSAANNDYWPEVYTDMPIVDTKRPAPYSDTPTPRRLGTVTPLDPEFFQSIDEFADSLLTEERSAKYSPSWVAQQLEEFAATASTQLSRMEAKTKNPKSPDFRRFSADVAIQIGLGRFFAAKFRAGMFYAIFRRGNYAPALAESIKSYHIARNTWAEMAQQAFKVYRSDLTFGFDKKVRGHWLDRLHDIDLDIADLEQLQASAKITLPKLDENAIKKAMREIAVPSPRLDPAQLAGFHSPPPTFVRGQPLTITAVSVKVNNLPRLTGVRLRYRRVNQAETWQSVAMEAVGNGYRTNIPADYTDSPFPLQYHFELLTAEGAPHLYPVLHPGWNGQPYFVIRQA